MNYTKMSDFEINHKVLAITSEVKPLGYAHNADKRSAGVVKSNEYHWYDFCNSWADAGPIIAANKISLDFDADGYEPLKMHGARLHHHAVRFITVERVSPSAPR